MHPDRDTGHRFPDTRRSVVAAARSTDAGRRRWAFEALAAAYWKPVYKYLRLRFQIPAEDAEDLTQGFFAGALEKDFFARYDPAAARFRTYLRVCLDGFVANHDKSKRRLKRGGSVRLLSLDCAGAEAELRRTQVGEPLDLEAFFHREWVRSLFSLALTALRDDCRRSGKTLQLALFERHDLEPADDRRRPSYADLATEFALPITQVTNYLAFARRQFRRRVLAELRRTTGSEAEFRAEARELLGVDLS